MTMRVVSLVLLVVLVCGAQGRILSQCDAAKELVRAGIERTFISTYVCIMKSESGFNTAKKTGPGHKASFSYGIFQISSADNKYCSAFRPAGLCNKNCNDFLNDDIQDDIACAKLIADREGFKHWTGWVKSCKKGKLPNVSGCIIRRDLEGEDWLEEEIEEDEELDLPVVMSEDVVPDEQRLL